MARISLHVEAESADDLRETLARMVGHIDLAVEVRRVVETGELEPDAGARQDAEPGERQAAATKFRRTQDEIARGLTVEQAKAERSAGVAASPASAPTASTADPVSTASEVEVDPFAEPTASQPTSEGSTATTAQTTTLDDVKKAMSGFLSRDGNDGAKLVGKCKLFKSAEGDDCQRASQLQPHDYEAFIAELAA